MRMIQLAENSALPFETFLAAVPHESEVQQLDRCLAFETSIVATGQPDAAHATMAKGGDQRISAEVLPGQHRLWQLGGGMFEKMLFLQKAVLDQQVFQQACQLWVALAQRSQPGSSFLRRHGQSLIKVRTYFLPLVGIELVHGLLIATNSREGCGADRFEPSPSCAAPFAPRRRA